MSDRPLEPSVEMLRRASQAIYLAASETVADDVSKLLVWAADEIERLRALTAVDA